MNYYVLHNAKGTIMEDKQISIDKFEELFLMQQYVNYLASQNPIISLLECPISSINGRDFVKGQCIPDAIINCGDSSKGWVELTTFSRCQEMRQQIGDLRKHPDKFEGEEYIPGIPCSLFQSLQLGLSTEAPKNKQGLYSVYQISKS